MKKLLSLALAMALMFSFAACGTSSGTDSSSSTSGASSADPASESSSEASAAPESSEEAAKPETVTIKSLNGNKEETDLEVPYDAQRIAVMDMAALDILDSLGLGDRVVGSSSTSLDYLQDYVTNESVSNLGTIKEADMEAVMACEPDVIFIGGRLSSSYDALSEIAPVVFLSTDTEIGVVESVRKNASTIASMFGVEDQVDSLVGMKSGQKNELQNGCCGGASCRCYCVIGFSVRDIDGIWNAILVFQGFRHFSSLDEYAP